jgi:hypothetical protein
MSDDERSGSGAPIWRHDEPAPGADEISGGDPELIEAMSDHVERHLGLGEEVLHEAVSPAVHLDLLVSPATEEIPLVVTTCGMAEKPMQVPEELADEAYAELCILLPHDWPLSHEAWEDERNWWPLRLLKTLARMPHEYGTWLWEGHTVPNGDPLEPYAEGTELCAALVMAPAGLPEEFWTLPHPRGGTINVRMVVPLHADELQLKLDEGTDALYDRFVQSDFFEPIVDPARPSVVGGRRRKRFGLF